MGERPFASVHEDALAVLRPEMTLTEQDLHLSHRFAKILVNDPRYLDWFGSDEQITRDGETLRSDDILLKRQRIFAATSDLVSLLENLEDAVLGAEKTQAWHPPLILDTPPGFESFLWRALQYDRTRFAASPWRFILAALTGQLYVSMIIVSQRHVKGAPQGATLKFCKVYGVIRNDPPVGRNVWFSDATADVDVLESLLNGTVIDATPDGVVPLHRKAEQYHRDITRKTQPTRLRSLIRGLLCRFTDRANVGIITHRNLLSAIERLEPEFRERIVKTTYYGSGDERSSNDWYGQCDLILVLGTPRVPSETVIEYLIRIGELEAACRPSVWGDVFWHAELASGNSKKLSGRGYHDPLWMKAHRAIVRANIVQAIGRGRGILKDGCDVIVLSTEECGLRVIDAPAPLLGDHLWTFHSQLRKLTARKSINSIYKKLAVSTSEVAQATHLPERTARHLLREFEALHLVHRDGPRSGWLLGPASASTQQQVNSISHHTSQIRTPQKGSPLWE